MEDFETLYRSYYPEVYRYLLRLCGDASLAEEITQEAFFRALRSLKSYRGDGRFSVWVCQIAKHTLYKELKRQKREILPDCLPETPDPEDDVEAQTADRAAAEEIRSKMDELPEPYRTVFRMRILEERPFSEIAQHFGKTESWARVTFHRAKLRLQEGLL